MRLRAAWVALVLVLVLVPAAAHRRLPPHIFEDLHIFGAIRAIASDVVQICA
ncbi:hypothetical protein [Microbacterium esteraromaticum]|uniref:hypothetical protein n=1 Tax=Microbacterium esteraromaticum TaxID=57043 RepID=UPI001C954F53|nr:hypothetical protein [Microbacterium esteraromaticum]MBY6061090.1 hypothetical protein [Microbacterium esteraromaticum]